MRKNMLPSDLEEFNRRKASIHKNKGYSLIETLTSLIIASLLLAILTTILPGLFKNYRVSSDEASEKIKVMRAFEYIEGSLQYSFFCNTSNNVLYIKKNSSGSKSGEVIIVQDSIYMNKNNNTLVISVPQNIILRDVKEFKADFKNGLVYLKIITNSLRCYERCVSFHT